MEIKKIGHCCLLIQYKGKTILTDPGAYSDGQNNLTNIDIVLITHEHGDHMHVPSVQEIIQNNPNVTIYSNSGVGKILDDHGITYTLLEGSDSITVEDIVIKAVDGKHEEIFEDMGQVQNTGYMLDTTFFYPGDSFTHPNTSVDVLALPVAGPWCKIPDAIRYALDVQPKIAFPVHDGMLVNGRQASSIGAPANILPQHAIEWFDFLENDTLVIDL